MHPVHYQCSRSGKLGFLLMLPGFISCVSLCISCLSVYKLPNNSLFLPQCTVEFLWTHTTESMCVGYMSANDRKARVRTSQPDR